ncbi:hypothetical protein B0J14DRAFT_502094 [Halenospora varia]|nr:hypothetical protein B0J14DRAFT_502094 [Halenospora varia]
MSQDMPIGFQDSQMSFTGDNQPLQDQNMMGYNFTGYSIPMMQPCDGLPRLTPSLDFEGCSPSSFGESSPTSADFVIPSQTTFDPFDMQSPMKQINSLHIDLQYTDDYSNEFMLSNSPMGSLRCFQGSTVRSCSTTPSLSSTSRQPKCEPIESAIALQRVQTLIKEDPDQKPEIKLRMHRRKIKRESRHPQLPQNILHAEKADKPCLFPGCGKKFRRSEHLKRHARIHDPQSCEAYPCPFCPKIFDNRSDNLKQHVKIHGDPTKKSSRTEYIGQRALDWLAAKDRETRRSKVKKEEAA